MFISKSDSLTFLSDKTVLCFAHGIGCEYASCYTQRKYFSMYTCHMLLHYIQLYSCVGVMCK